MIVLLDEPLDLAHVLAEVRDDISASRTVGQKRHKEVDAHNTTSDVTVVPYQWQLHLQRYLSKSNTPCILYHLCPSSF